MTTEEMDLILKRKEMSKQAWIKNVMRIYPEKTLQETEDLHNILFEEPEMPIVHRAETDQTK